MFQTSSWLVLDYAMDQRVLTYLIAISIGTGLLFGLAPALRLSKSGINTAIKDAGRGVTAGLSMLLVTGEMVLAIVLLAGAGVLIRSFLKIHSANMGVNTANVLVGTQWGELPATRYVRADARVAFYDQIRSRVRSTPGVESAAFGVVASDMGRPALSVRMERRCAGR